LELKSDNPLVAAVLADQVDVEATLARSPGADPDLGNFLTLIRVLTSPLRYGEASPDSIHEEGEE
jgi:hypothetical protein